MTTQGNLQGKVAVVTGSSTGIGRAIAIRLAQAGADVVVHGRSNSTNLSESADLISKTGQASYLLPCDLSCEDDYQSFVDDCWNWKSKIDIWINNAGADVLTGAAKSESFGQKLTRVIQVDVRASLLLSRMVGQKMVEAAPDTQGQASITNIGWDQAWQGMEGDSGEMFSASKGSIMAMTKSLAQSLAPKVRVNCVAPGWIKTSWGNTAPPEWDRRAKQESLMARWGTPEDIANAVAFLSSPEASFISGQVLNVNGGFRYNQSGS